MASFFLFRSHWNIKKTSFKIHSTYRYFFGLCASNIPRYLLDFAFKRHNLLRKEIKIFVTPTDRPKSVRNCCVSFWWHFCVVALLFGLFCGCRGFWYRTELDLFLYLLLTLKLRKRYYYVMRITIVSNTSVVLRFRILHRVFTGFKVSNPSLYDSNVLKDGCTSLRNQLSTEDDYFSGHLVLSNLGLTDVLMFTPVSPKLVWKKLSCVIWQ